MINLLYVILIAMLAINISGEVLDGFITSNRDLKSNIEELKAYNEVLERQLAESKNTEMAQQAVEMKKQLLSLNETIARMGHAVEKTAQESSFSKGMEVDDDLNAVKEVMLKQQNASALKAAIEKFKEGCLPLATNEASRKMIANLLDTNAHENGKTWEEEHFANLPVIGCIMMMSKIEKDMWLALNEGMRCVAGQVELNDSLMQAPEKENLPELDNDLLKALVAQMEKRNQLEQQQTQNKVVKNEQGKVSTLVMTENRAPLFANYENILNVTVVSEHPTHLVVSLTNGSIRKAGNHYVAIPNGKSQTATLTVKDGKKVLTQYDYKVLPLPVPTPSLVYTALSGKQREYRSSVPLSPKEIQSISQIRLHMDGGVDTKESVAGFDLMVIKNGNKTVEMEHASGAKVTPDMKKLLGNVVKGDKVIFTNITVKGSASPARQTVSVNVIPM